MMSVSETLATKSVTCALISSRLTDWRPIDTAIALAHSTDASISSVRLCV